MVLTQEADCDEGTGDNLKGRKWLGGICMRKQTRSLFYLIANN